MIYNFPHIETLSDLEAHIEGIDYLCVSEKENHTKVVSYIYTTKDSFANEWERECRGITFDKDGKIISRTLHKFFNLGERESYMLNKLDLTQVKGIYPKLDGSMISHCIVDGEVLVKSKNSFFSDVAVKAQNFIDKEEHSEYHRFCKDMSEKGYTATFEYTGLQNRIVVRYEKEELTLLCIRDNITGEYLDISELSKGYDIKVLQFAYDAKDVDINKLIEDMETVKDIEGYIIAFNSGDMVKIKCDWYCELHNSITFIRERDIAFLVCNESLDDFRALISRQKYDGIDMEKVDAIESEIISYVEYFRKEVKNWISEILVDNSGVVDFKHASSYLMKNKDRYKDHSFVFDFVMTELRGREIDYFTHYRRHVLKKTWSLESLEVYTEEDQLNLDDL